MAEESLNSLGLMLEFRREVDRAGGVKAWAQANGISIGYVSEALNGAALPGPKIINALGYIRVERFVRARKEKVHA